MLAFESHAHCCSSTMTPWLPTTTAHCSLVFALCSWLRALCSLIFILCFLLYALCSVLCALYLLLCALCSVLCSLQVNNCFWLFNLLEYVPLFCLQANNWYVAIMFHARNTDYFTGSFIGTFFALQHFRLTSISGSLVRQSLARLQQSADLGSYTLVII